MKTNFWRVFLLSLMIFFMTAQTSNATGNLTTQTAMLKNIKFSAPLSGQNFSASYFKTSADYPDLPASFDLRKTGRVTPIRNQNPWGTCWAFAATAALESNYLTNNPNTKPEDVDFSEMHMTWFSRMNTNDASRNFSKYDKGRAKIIRMGDYGKALQEGGYPLIPVAYLSRLDGPVNESDFPYPDSKRFSDKGFNINNPPAQTIAENSGIIPRAASSTPYSINFADGTKTPQKNLRLTEALYVSIQAMPGNFANQKQLYGVYNLVQPYVLKDTIRKYGAAMISYYSNENSRRNFNANTHGYFSNSQKVFGNHEITIVGWDDNYSKENFLITPQSNGAWLARNNWGNFTGSNGGYEWISYSDVVGDGVVLVVKDRPENLRVYEHDPLGWCNSLGFEQEDIYAANVFQVDSDGEILNSVGFYTTFQEMDVDIEIYDLGTTFSGTNPRNGQKIFSASENYQLAGYHTINTDAVNLERGHYFSVVQHNTNKFEINIPDIRREFGVDTPYSGDITYWRPIATFAVEAAIKGYSNNAATYDGESFFSPNGEYWLDGTSVMYGFQQTDSCGGSTSFSGMPSFTNACIKVFTVAPNYSGTSTERTRTILNLEARKFSGASNENISSSVSTVSIDKTTLTASAGSSSVSVYLANKTKTYEPINWNSMHDEIEDVDTQDDEAKGLMSAREWALVPSYEPDCPPDLYFVQNGITYPVYGPFVFDVSGGNFEVDVNALKYSDGKDGRIPEGYYTAIYNDNEVGVIHFAATGDKHTPSNTDNPTSNGGGGGGGCNALCGIFLAAACLVFIRFKIF